MNLEEIINFANNNNILLSVKGDKLIYKAMQGALTLEFLEALKNNKLQLIEKLRSESIDSTPDHSLSYNQQSLWFLNMFDKDTAAYNVPIACIVQNEIDKNAFIATIADLINRHPILRTTYRQNHDNISVSQYIQPTPNLSIDFINGAGLSDSELYNTVYSLYKQPFDLESGPVYRICLINKNENETILLIVFHHIACDGWSLNIFCSEFTEIYNSFVNKNEIKLEKDQSDYTDFVHYQKALLKSPEGDRLFKFWEESLSGIPHYLNLPLDYPRPSIQKLKGSSFFFNIESELYNDLKNFAKNNKTTLNSVLLSTFQILLIAKSGQKKILLGTLASGRKNKKFHKTFGYFVNPIVIPGFYSGTKPFNEYLTETSTFIFKALEHQEYPFSLLVEKIATDRAPDKAPIFQVLFNFLQKNLLGSVTPFLFPDDQNNRTYFGNFHIKPYIFPNQEGQYDLTLEIVDTGTYLYSVFKYNTTLFKKETIIEYISDFKKLLKLVLNQPGIPISELSAIIEQKNQLSKRGPLLKIACSATFTIDLIEQAANFWFDKIGLNAQIAFCPYNQVFQELYDAKSLFHNNTNGINVTFIRFDDWLQENDSYSISNLSGNSKHFLDAISSAAKNTSSTYIVIFCPPSPTLLQDENKKSQLLEIENSLYSDLISINGVHPVSSNEQKTLYPVENFYEPMGEDIGHIPYTQDFFDAISTLLARKIYNITHKPYKVIVLDCDNTLWDGVVGEDGIWGVKVSPQKKRLQEFVVSQHQAGMVICLCSKNKDTDVSDVINQHPDMVLKEAHIAVQKINWLPKSQNIMELSQELNLGLESFIFIDDNPIECAEVQTACPEVLVIQLPGIESELELLFKHIWAFDHLKVTQEDTKRSEFYKADHQRKSCMQESASFADFIKGLNLEISISGMKSSAIPRVSQLTHRTNQFNMTTIRRSESEILHLNKLENYYLKTIKVADRFGDYGLVGVLIAKSDEDSLIVDTFILSCRALGKGVEHEMAAHLGHLAESLNLSYIEISCLPTERNMPAKAFLDATISDYAENKNGGWVYRIPTVVASAIRFEPDSGLKASTGKKSAKKETVKAPQNASTRVEGSGKILLDIARNFSDISTLSKFIHPIKKSSFNAEPSNIVTSSVFNKTGPSSQTESYVAEIWQNVLKMDKINPDDKFFEIGGKSVLIPQIVIQLKKKYNLGIRIVDVFQYPTIKSLSAFIDRQPPIKGSQMTENSALLKQKQRALKVRNMFQRKRQ